MAISGAAPRRWWPIIGLTVLGALFLAPPSPEAARSAGPSTAPRTGSDTLLETLTIPAGTREGEIWTKPLAAKKAYRLVVSGVFEVSAGTPGEMRKPDWRFDALYCFYQTRPVYFLSGPVRCSPPAPLHGLSVSSDNPNLQAELSIYDLGYSETDVKPPYDGGHTYEVLFRGSYLDLPLGRLTFYHELWGDLQHCCYKGSMTVEIYELEDSCPRCREGWLLTVTAKMPPDTVRTPPLDRTKTYRIVVSGFIEISGFDWVEGKRRRTVSRHDALYCFYSTRISCNPPFASPSMLAAGGYNLNHLDKTREIKPYSPSHVYEAIFPGDGGGLDLRGWGGQLDFWSSWWQTTAYEYTGGFTVQVSEVGKEDEACPAAGPSTRLRTGPAAGPGTAGPEKCRPFVIITPSSLDAQNRLCHGRDRCTVGALDFANQQEDRQTPAQSVDIFNGGTAPLIVKRVIPGPHFPIVRNGCPDRAPGLSPGKSCSIVVAFKPDRASSLPTEEMTIETNAGEYRVSLDGTGTLTALPPLSAAEEEGASRVPLGEHPCYNSLNPLKPYFGWKLFDGAEPKELWGQVVQSHITSADFYKNHYNIDFNQFVYPDKAYRGLLGRPGSFRHGDPMEFGRLEVEWERDNHLPGRRGGNELPEGTGGFPEWAWPALGDRVLISGSHVWDCGHGGPSWLSSRDINDFRTEIHPPRLVVTYRNAALTPFAGADARLGRWYNFGDGPTWATEVDIFASSFAGNVITDLGKLSRRTPWWQRINDRDYSITIVAPPKPAPDAVLTRQVTVHPIPGSEGRVVLEFTPAGDGYIVKIPLSKLGGEKGRLQAVGFTVWVGWRPGTSGKLLRPQPRVVRYRVTVEELIIHRKLDEDWRLYGYVNEQGGALLGELVDWAGEPYMTDVEKNGMVITRFRRVRPGQPAGTFVVSVVDGQRLHIQFRGINHFPSGYKESKLAGIVDYILRPGQPVPSSPVVLAAGARGAAGAETEGLDEGCRAVSCFSIKMTIRKLTGP